MSAKVSKNIKKLRNENGLTQDGLAEKINVTRQTVSSWETGRTQPDIEMLELLAETFGTGIEEIIYGEKRKIGLEAPKSDRRKTLNIVFATLGSLLSATGVIIILVSFWDKLPDFFLSFLCFLPLLAGGGIAAWSYIKKKTGIGWSEGASVAWVAGLASTLGLTAAMFGVNIDLYAAVIGMCSMILPISFIMNSVFPLTVYYALTTFYLADTAYFGLTDAFPTVSGIIIFLAGMLFVFKHPANDYRRKYSTWILIISASVIITTLSAGTAQNETSAISCIVTAILTALYAADRDGDFLYPFRYISVPALSVIMCVFCVNNEVFISSAYSLETPDLMKPGIAPFAAAAIIATGILFGKKSFKGNFTKTAFTVLSASVTAMCAVCTVISDVLGYYDSNGDITSITITLISLAASITLIVAGIKKAKLLTVNLGLIMLCFIVYLTIFAGNFDFVYSGIACTVMGGILLFLNYKMSKSFKAKESEKNA